VKLNLRTGSPNGDSSGEKTPWELYNERAQIYDRETIKEWEDNLSIHLVFVSTPVLLEETIQIGNVLQAALFSAVLTAFITVSLPILQEDNQETMKEVLFTISRQLNNASFPPYQTVAFKPPSWAVRVNILFFTSLGCNLFAAFSSVLALQWVRDYDMGLSAITEPRERALRRQLRLEGVQNWLLPEIISMLIPTLLHVALLLFVGALLVWLIQIHLSVAYTMMFTLTITASFYIGTQFISSINPSVPYKTPLSRRLESIRRSITAFIKTNLSKRYRGRESTMSGTSHVVGHQSSELESVRSSPLLPSSALFWLLNHIDHSDRLVQVYLDTCHHLFESEQSSTLAQAHPQDLVHWSTIIDNVAQHLGSMRQSDQTYPKYALDHFLTLFCGLAIFGGDSIELSPSTWLIFTRAPFSQSGFHWRPVGLTCRFALWRNGRGFPRDISGPPVDLFNEICLHYGKVPDLIIISALRELRMLFNTNLLTSKEIQRCLMHLLNSSDPNNGVVNLFWNRGMATEVLVTIGTLLNIPRARTTKVQLEEEISRVFDACIIARNEDKWSSDFDPLLYSLLPQILYDLTRDQDDKSVLKTLALLQHPAISSVWIDGAICSRLDRTASVANDYFWEKARKLYPKRSDETPVFSVELVHSILALLSRLPRTLVPRSDTWHMMSSCLMTLACCVSGQPYDETLVREITEQQPSLWVVQLLTRLESGMKDPTLAFLISALLMGHVRRLYGRNLHCAVTLEGMIMIREIYDPLLRLIGCLLLGWEYEEFIPGQDDPVWRTSAMKVAMDFKNGFGPYVLYSSDGPLLLAMAGQNDEFLERKAFWFLTKYSGLSVSCHITFTMDVRFGSGPLPFTQIFAERTASRARKATAEELLRMGLPLFNRSPKMECYHIRLMTQWSFRDLFLPHFIDLGGLEWLSGLTFACTERCADCIPFTSPIAGLVLCLRDYIEDYNLTPESLPEKQSKILLQTPLLRDTFPGEDSYHYLYMVQMVFRHLETLECSGDNTFPDAAAKCEEIISDETRRQQCWDETDLKFGPGKFNGIEEWTEDVKKVITGLRRGERRATTLVLSVSPVPAWRDYSAPTTSQAIHSQRPFWRLKGRKGVDLGLSGAWGLDLDETLPVPMSIEDNSNRQLGDDNDWRAEEFWQVKNI
jgi:hypothetical protein